MTDPYNTATPLPRATETPADAPPASRPATRVQPKRSNAITPSERTALLPVLNVVALLILLTTAGFKGGMKFSSFLVGCCPLLLAIAASIWNSSSAFVIVARLVNAVLAVMVLLRLMRYVSHGIFNGGMLLMLVLVVLVPVFNALYLKPKPAE